MRAFGAWCLASWCIQPPCLHKPHSSRVQWQDKQTCISSLRQQQNVSDSACFPSDPGHISASSPHLQKSHLSNGQVKCRPGQWSHPWLWSGQDSQTRADLLLLPAPLRFPRQTAPAPWQGKAWLLQRLSKNYLREGRGVKARVGPAPTLIAGCPLEFEVNPPWDSVFCCFPVTWAIICPVIPLNPETVFYCFCVSVAMSPCLSAPPPLSFSLPIPATSLSSCACVYVHPAPFMCIFGIELRFSHFTY